VRVELEVELGNEAMQTVGDVSEAVQRSFAFHARSVGGFVTPLVPGDRERVRDENGNTVGRWEVTT
jgi:hypothetical protein